MNPQNPNDTPVILEDQENGGGILGGTENCPAERMIDEYFYIKEVPENGNKEENHSQS